MDEWTLMCRIVRAMGCLSWKKLSLSQVWIYCYKYFLFKYNAQFTKMTKHIKKNNKKPLVSLSRNTLPERDPLKMQWSDTYNKATFLKNVQRREKKMENFHMEWETILKGGKIQYKIPNRNSRSEDQRNEKDLRTNGSA